MKQSFVEGVLLREVFRNTDSDFSISSILLLEHNAPNNILKKAVKSVDDAVMPPGFENQKYYDAITISGYFPKLDSTRSYRFLGYWTQHKRYGWQFQVQSFESKQVINNSKASVIAYLSSAEFKGIGPKAAKLVVDALGENAISKIIKDRAVLSRVSGLSGKQKRTIFETATKKQGDELILGPLYNYGISARFALRVMKKYEGKALEVVQNNPYQLIHDIEGIGFLRADEIAGRIGIEKDDPRRVNAALVHVMSNETSKEGHTYLTREQLIEAANAFLSRDILIEISIIEKEIDALIEKKQLVVLEDKLFLPQLALAEAQIANKIKSLIQKERLDDKKISAAFETVSEKLEIEYGELQKQAILESLAAGISIITGGPGTGKTTVVNGILKVYEQLHKKAKKEKVIKLASPTGRAAKRLTEATGYEATTIHKMLGYSRDGTFAVNEDDPLEADLVIIDEVSMLDTYLAYQLFISLKSKTQVILVGDDHQLPSVGPGKVLEDLIKSNALVLTRLTEIHRQAAGSSVVTLAHEINAGKLPADLHEKKPDRLFAHAQNADILRLIKQVTQGAIDKGYTEKEVQVLIPMYRGELGIDNVNAELQMLFNPAADEKSELQLGQKTFREGDKVLQLSNNPDAGVMNGDVGEIVRIIKKGSNIEVLVDFDDLEVKYNREDLVDLTHAYVMSVHKSQGSEYPVVIMPMTRAYFIMLRRPLIYTAVTRAAQSLIIIGDEEALAHAARNVGLTRQTFLKERLADEAPEVQEEKTSHLEVGGHEGYFKLHEIPFEGIDEAGLEGVSPYDFMH